MSWTLTAPKQYTRPLFAAENLFDFLQTDLHGYTQVLLGATLTSTVPITHQMVQKVWRNMRWEFPNIATTLDGSEGKRRLVYTVEDEAGVEDWVRRTLVSLNGEGEKPLETLREKLSHPDDPFGPDNVMIYLLSRKDERTYDCLLRANHAVVDALGGLHCLRKVLERLAGFECMESIGEWGQEVDRLAPGLEVTTSHLKKALSTSESDKCFEDVLGLFGKCQPWHGIPSLTPTSRAPTTGRIAHTYTQLESKQIITKSKSLGLTVTEFIESVMAVACTNLHPTSEDKWMFILTPQSLRTYLPKPYNEPGYVALAQSSFPVMIPTSVSTVTDGLESAVTRTGKVIKDIMKGIRDDELFWDKYEGRMKGMLAANKFGLAGPLPSHMVPVFNSVGIVEHHLPSAYNDMITLTDVLVSFRNPNPPDRCLYLWTQNNQITVSLIYNKAGATDDEMWAYLGELRRVVNEVCGVSKASENGKATDTRAEVWKGLDAATLTGSGKDLDTATRIESGKFLRRAASRDIVAGA